MYYIIHAFYKKIRNFLLIFSLFLNISIYLQTLTQTRINKNYEL